ncbi:MAG: sensor histidine kinase [Alphaproteobacteria bacterium]|nr:sensor histidine kinase [Alphaproteobacteria bacterium]MCL2504956.1 sensor histidine kinase [Alphaproteobacteria bacterium]
MNRSSLRIKILIPNVIALIMLAVGVLYYSNYQESVIKTQHRDMLNQARIVANAIAENAIVIEEDGQSILSPLLSRLMLSRLAKVIDNRISLFSSSDRIIADTEYLSEDASQMDSKIKYLAVQSLEGEHGAEFWYDKDGNPMLAVSVPIETQVQNADKEILGALTMSRSGASVIRAVHDVRLNIIQIFFAVLGVTILLSLYLARTIANPIKQLAAAAEEITGDEDMRLSYRLNTHEIPDMTERKDEIGELSKGLRSLTGAISKRLGSIENFAADVAHELKNPITSLRSAAETLEKIKDDNDRAKLLSVIKDDIDRMNRLVTDISNASRLDAELSRETPEAVNMTALLSSVAEAYKANKVNIETHIEDNIFVFGIDRKLAQVIRNLIDNAVSFSSKIYVKTITDKNTVSVIIEDNGIGIPENKLETIFDRFYTQRPKDEKFGTHSGLGLSISRQIINAHKGRIFAENRKDGGARFIVELPLM